jgi:hypothetical protein
MDACAHRDAYIESCRLEHQADGQAGGEDEHVQPRVRHEPPGVRGGKGEDSFIRPTRDGVVGKDGGAAKRKREEGKPSGKQPKVSKEEAEAQAKRAAARARVEARTMKSFGLQ